MIRPLAIAWLSLLLALCACSHHGNGDDMHTHGNDDGGTVVGDGGMVLSDGGVIARDAAADATVATDSGESTDADASDLGADAGDDMSAADGALVLDANATDAGAIDDASMDAGANDLGPLDMGAIDLGAIDSGIDSGARDMGAADARVDLGAPDLGPLDSGTAPDSGSAPDLGIDMNVGMMDAGTDLGMIVLDSGSDSAIVRGNGDSGFVGCLSGPDCDDNNLCTLDTCLVGTCLHRHLSVCSGCTSSSQCVDGDSTTVDICDHGSCFNYQCLVDSDCNDNNACTADQCYGVACQHPSSGLCCQSSQDCDDFNNCTNDSCNIDSLLCVHQAIALCTYCIDADHDDHPAISCGGDDCDDNDPQDFPGNIEICDDGHDNNCDGLSDTADPFCTPTNNACDAAQIIGAGSNFSGTIAPGSSSSMCGPSNYYIVVAATTVHLSLDMSLSVPAEGSGEQQFVYRAFLENIGQCGNPSADLFDGATSGACESWNNMSGTGLETATFTATIPAGTYFIEVEAQRTPSHATAVSYVLSLTMTPTP